MNSNKATAIDHKGGIGIVELCQIVWRYKHIIAPITALFAVVSILYALTAKPVFRSEVVTIEANKDSAHGLGSLASQLGSLASLAGVNLGGGDGQQVRAVLASRHLAEEFVRRNQLERILVPEGKSSLWLAVERFKQGVLKIREDKLKNTIVISVDWEDPATAARWANGFVALANELIRKRALSDSTGNIAYLTKQIANTSSVEVQKAMYALIENESKTLMFANAKTEYALTTIDPAVPPELRISPKRTLIVVFGTLIGGIVGVFVALFRNALLGKHFSLQ